MNKLKHLLALLSLTLFTFSLSAQLPYSEDFTGQVGRGAFGSGLNYDTVGLTWTVDVSASNFTATTDYFKVINVSSNDLLEARDTDGEVVWKSEVYDVSGLGLIDLSVDLSETGTMEATSDYCNVYYILNGNGTEVLFSVNGENKGDFTSLTASESGLAGTSVQIIVRIDNNADSEKHRIDNVSVTSSSGYVAPVAGDLVITEYARHSNSSYGYLEIYNTTASKVDISSVKIVSDGSNDAVYDFGVDLVGNAYVPENGFLILNRNGSQSNFESNWTSSTGNTVSLGSDVNYNRTGINAFGNNNVFKIRLGGTADTDDGTLIDESTFNASSLGKRVYQLPLGYWNNNEDDFENSTPGYLGENENIKDVNLVYSDGSWRAATGYANSAPSALTGAAEAIVLRGQAVIDNGSLLKKLTIMADAGLDLDNQSVVVSDEIIVEHDGSLSITGTGSVTCPTGTITIKKEGHNTNTDFNIWGSPFAGSIDITDVFTNQFNCDMYVFEASSQSWKYDEDLSGNLNCNGNIYAMNSGLGISATDGEGTPDGNFDIGRGYFIAGNASNKVSFSKASGVLNNGGINVKIFGSSTTPTDGSNDWNLISNPYPSSISVKSFLEGNNATDLSNAVYIYNPGTGMNSSSSYDTYNSSHTTRYIASGQGFYVNGNTTTDGYAYDVAFTNSMRHHTNNDFRSILSYEGVYLDVVDDNGENDPLRLFFDMEASNDFDSKYDAVKLPNGDFNFSSKLGDKKLVFNGMEEIGMDVKIIPLYFQTAQTSNYTIELDSLVGSFTNRDVLLEDRYMRKFHNIKQAGYVFQSNPKEWANRFYLHIIPKKNNNGSGHNGGGAVSDTTNTVTSISELDNSALKVYYANQEIIIGLTSDNQKITEIQVIAANGKVVLERKATDSVVKISTNSYPTGLYLIKTTLDNNQVQVDRVVIR